MKLLLADADTTLADVTTYALRRAGFDVVTARNETQTMDYWCTDHPDLILLDRDLPPTDGMTVCHAIRHSSDIPIIVLSARHQDDDVVAGLEGGADDYVLKPFSYRQLVARIHALLRRKQMRPRQAALQFGDVIVDSGAHEVRSPQGAIRLTKLEFRLLHYLLVNCGQVLPTDAIITHVWGYAGSGNRSLLKQLIYRVRRKVESPEAAQHTIEAVPGVGYRITRSLVGAMLPASEYQGAESHSNGVYA